jgi:hypothetical protein
VTGQIDGGGMRELVFLERVRVYDMITLLIDVLMMVMNDTD